MFSIIGGCYREVCLEPVWDELFGSGVRAACAVAAIISKSTNNKVSLHTWTSPSERRDLAMKAQTFDITLSAYDREQLIEFQYDYGLASPRIYPDPRSISRVSAQDISIDNGLVFGLLEDTPRNHETVQAKVKGNSIVYDPQAETNAVPWKETGHKCKRLAIVANMLEAEAMVRQVGVALRSDVIRPQALAISLLESQEAEVVIVKNGAEGAFVVTANDVHHILSYKTDTVFPFGSGDIFSAVFAAYWAELGIDAVPAAQRASMAAACHSHERILPIPLDLEDRGALLVPLRITRHEERSQRPQVYIAAPLFNFPQRWFLGEVRRRLNEQGVKTFSPLHEVGVNKPVNEIVSKDLAGLDASKVLFAILDGLDSGTLFEIGYAVAKKIPVIGFRQTATDGDLTMLQGSPSCRIFDDLPSAIYHAAWTALEQ